MNERPLKMGGNERGAADAALEVRDGTPAAAADSEVDAAVFVVASTVDDAVDARLGEMRHAGVRWGEAALLEIGALIVVDDKGLLDA